MISELPHLKPTWRELTTGSLEPSGGSSWLVGLRQCRAPLPELLRRSMPARLIVRLLTAIDKIYAGDDPVNEADPSGDLAGSGSDNVPPWTPGLVQMANTGRLQ